MSDSINLTPAATQHFCQILRKQREGSNVRLSVKNSGCSGLKYNFDYTTEVQPDDLAIPMDKGITLYVDSKSFIFVKGATIDCVQTGLNKQLKIINPNETASCGCGESFSVS